MKANRSTKECESDKPVSRVDGEGESAMDGDHAANASDIRTHVNMRAIIQD